MKNDVMESLQKKRRQLNKRSSKNNIDHLYERTWRRRKTRNWKKNTRTTWCFMRFKFHIEKRLCLHSTTIPIEVILQKRTYICFWNTETKYSTQHQLDLFQILTLHKFFTYTTKTTLICFITAKFSNYIV